MLRPIHGHVQVDFNYAVHFTNDLFAADNSLLSQVVCADDALDKPTRVMWVVDRAVDQFCDVKSRIESYFAAHFELELAGEVLLLEGGENIKNRPELVLEIQATVNETGLDRHSYIAGDALLGEHHATLMQIFRERALSQLPGELAQHARASLDNVYRSDTPESKAFQVADSLDRVLEMQWHAHSAEFTLDVALSQMDIIHPGPVQAFQLEIMREAGFK